MLKCELQKLQNKISKLSVKVDDGLSARLIKIMFHVDDLEVSPFMKFFWEQK